MGFFGMFIIQIFSKIGRSILFSLDNLEILLKRFNLCGVRANQATLV